MANIQYNVGTWAGILGTAVIYEAKTTGGEKFLCYKALQSDDSEKWEFMSRSGFQSQMVLQKATLAAAVSLDSYADVVPAGVLNANGFVQIGNDTDTPLPRLFTNQALFSLRGKEIAAYTGTDVSSRTGGDSGTIVINSNGRTISEVATEGVDWVTKNPLIIVAIGFIMLELFGVTNFLGLKKKKTAKRRR
jgi:hypothetical protein